MHDYFLCLIYIYFSLLYICKFDFRFVISIAYFIYNVVLFAYLDVSVRPAELFQLKLVPLLKEHGINNLDNRKEWPVSVLKSVLLSLIEETPSDRSERAIKYDNFTLATLRHQTYKPLIASDSFKLQKAHETYLTVDSKSELCKKKQQG